MADIPQHADVAAQVVDMAVKAAPPVAVTGMTFFGVPLPDIVALLTIVYLLVHMGYIIKKWIKGE